MKQSAYVKAAGVMRTSSIHDKCLKADVIVALTEQKSGTDYKVLPGKLQKITKGTACRGKKSIHDRSVADFIKFNKRVTLRNVRMQTDTRMAKAC